MNEIKNKLIAYYLKRTGYRYSTTLDTVCEKLALTYSRNNKDQFDFDSDEAEILFKRLRSKKIDSAIASNGVVQVQRVLKAMRTELEVGKAPFKDYFKGLDFDASRLLEKEVADLSENRGIIILREYSKPNNGEDVPFIVRDLYDIGCMKAVASKHNLIY